MQWGGEWGGRGGGEQTRIAFFYGSGGRCKAAGRWQVAGRFGGVGWGEGEGRGGDGDGDGDGWVRMGR